MSLTSLAKVKAGVSGASVHGAAVRWLGPCVSEGTPCVVPGVPTLPRKVRGANLLGLAPPGTTIGTFSDRVALVCFL